MSCILSKLHILCSSLVKLYYTKMTIHPLFTIHMLQPFHTFSIILGFIKVEWSIYQNVHYFITTKNSVFNFTAVRSEWNDTMLKTTIHITCVICFLCMGVHGSKQGVWTSIWSSPYSGEFCNQNCIVETSEMFVWSAFC